MPGQARCRSQALQQKRSRLSCCAISPGCFCGRSSHRPIFAVGMSAAVQAGGASGCARKIVGCVICNVYNRLILSGVVSGFHELTPFVTFSRAGGFHPQFLELPHPPSLSLLCLKCNKDFGCQRGLSARSLHTISRTEARERHCLKIK